MRASIGAALQEAALDPLLTGARAHAPADRAARPAQGRAPGARAASCWSGSAWLAGRRPQSGRLLGRDETAARPGAGARPPAAHPLPRRADHRASTSRAAPRSGRRSRRLARRGGGHGLPHHPVPGGGRRARRPGRDHRPRPHRRRGHPGRAEGGDRPAHGRGRAAASAAERERLAAVLERFGAGAGASPRAAAARLEGGEAQLADVVRALDCGGDRDRDTCSCTPPRSTTSSSPRPAARWRAPGGGARADGRDGARDGGARVSGGLRTQVGQLARRSVLRTLRQPAQIVPALVFPLFLLAVNSGGLTRRDQPARLPDRLLPHLRPRRALHAGGALLGDEHRHRPRPRHRDRLPQPARADPAARRGAAQRPARRRRRARPACRRRPT